MNNALVKDDTIIKLKEESSNIPVIHLNVDYDSYEEISKEVLDLFYQLNESINNKEELSCQEVIIDKINEIRNKYIDNKSINDLIKSNYLKVLSINSSLKEYIYSNLYSSLDIDLSNVDISGIIDLYNNLNNSIENGSLKDITVNRGRLIRKLKKEDKSIEEEYKKVKPLIEIQSILSSDDISLDKIKEVVNNNDNLYYLFKDKLDNIDSFKEEFDNIFNKKEVEQTIFLGNMLSNELEKHKNVLNERYQTEFLDKKGDLVSVVKTLPNSLALSIKKINNSINEIKEARTNRKKVHLTLEALKNTGLFVATPVIYFGKFLASNWYSLYMVKQMVDKASVAIEEEHEEIPQIEEKKEDNTNIQEVKEEDNTTEVENISDNHKFIKEVRERINVKKQEAIERQKLEEKENRIREAREMRLKEKENTFKKYMEFKKEELEKQKLELEQQEEARQRAMEEAREQAYQRRLQNVEERIEQMDRPPVQSEVVTPDVSEDIPYPYDYLRGSQLIGLIASPAFGGDISLQLENGFADGDTLCNVRYIPDGVPWWQFWNFENADIPLRDVQKIWNWSPETDLDQYHVVEGYTK